MKTDKRTKKIAATSLCLALALVASYVEHLIPLDLGIPGIRLGLANIVAVVMLSLFGWPTALLVNVLRVVIANLLFGSLSGMLYGLCGALLSMLTMMLFQRSGRFSLLGVSAAGGVFHNVGQLGAAILVVENVNLIFYLPVLLIVGLSTGILIGYTAHLLLPPVKRALGCMR